MMDHVVIMEITLSYHATQQKIAIIELRTRTVVVTASNYYHWLLIWGS
jgi:hypothetical protein